jgi:hypothetical protein
MDSEMRVLSQATDEVTAARSTRSTALTTHRAPYLFTMVKYDSDVFMMSWVHNNISPYINGQNVEFDLELISYSRNTFTVHHSPFTMERLFSPCARL